MKKFLFGLVGVVLAGVGPLMGQSPAPVVAVPAGAPVGGCCAAPSGCCTTPSGCCANPSGQCCARDYTCVPQQYTKKKDVVTYCSTCEPFCLCYFHCCLRRGCDCESGHCEHPYSRHFLIKKVHTCEECATKCVPSPCGTGCCGATAGCCGSAAPVTPAPVMAAPAQAMPMAPTQPAR